MNTLMETMEKTIIVIRLSQKFGFDSDEAMRFLAEPMLVEEPTRIMTLADYTSLQIQSLEAVEQPREEEDRVYSVLPLMSERMICDKEDSSSDDSESVNVMKWTCVKTGIIYLKSCEQNCGKINKCNCHGDIYDIETQDPIGKWNGQEIVPLLSGDEESAEEDLQTSGASAASYKTVVRKKCKRPSDMMKCFKDGLRIRHIIGDNAIYGTYDLSNNKIVCIEETYSSLSAMAKAHYKQVCPGRRTKNTADGWKECECEIDGEWILAEKLYFD